ncbi:tetratricopeptide repeat protein [Aeromicrobium sp. 9AM]|uniref:tetratricopeptide repeat protein n=1 Tax=Aeromicrobium sp. 9AM TaxID=2653126 RepID=UPI00135A6BAC|nr:tetratricopeptide repeat protein [Aeromicrobium sp. 9AM]
MRKSVGAQQLLRGATGRRIPVAVGGLQTDERGKYQLVERDIVRVAELLPHVTIDVCRECNGGWMKRLEDDVKKLLGPWSVAGWPFRLDQDAQTALTTWATKSWMGYALIHKQDKGPFTAGERRTMADAPAPLARTRVWIVHSDASSARVAMGLQTTLLKPLEQVPDVTTEIDNAGFGFLAYNELAFFLVVAPQPNSQLLDAVEEQMDSSGYAKRIWPPSAPESFPRQCAPSHVMSELLAIPGNFQKAAELPVVGLSKSELEQVRRAHAVGLNTQQIRAIWQPESLAQLERKRISDDPDGYGKTWRPYRVLGGIDWHGGRFEAAVEHYRTAQRLGATVQDIGSQMCEALMFAGEYAEAQRMCEDVIAQGPNEWQDMFRKAILYEVIEQFGLERQKRRWRREDITVTVSDDTIHAAKRHLRRTDALDVVSWSVLAHDVRRGTRLSTIMASAYLGQSGLAWFLLTCQVASFPDEEPLRGVVADALAESPEIVAEVLEEFEEVDAHELRDARQFVEDCSQRSIAQARTSPSSLTRAGH